MLLKMSSAKWRPFCLSGDELIPGTQENSHYKGSKAGYMPSHDPDSLRVKKKSTNTMLTLPWPLRVLEGPGRGQYIPLFF